MGYVYGRARRTSETRIVSAATETRRDLSDLAPLSSRARRKYPMAVEFTSDNMRAIISGENIIKTARCNKGSRLLFFFADEQNAAFQSRQKYTFIH